jgi:hypothetical protein
MFHRPCIKMCWNSVKTIEFSIIQRDHNCCHHKSYVPRGLFLRSYFMCNFIVLEFNNTYSLICFRILCNSIYVEKAEKRIKFTFKKCQSSLIFYCKIPVLCQSLAQSAQILLVMSDRTDTFHELWYYISKPEICSPSLIFHYFL